MSTTSTTKILDPATEFAGRRALVTGGTRGIGLGDLRSAARGRGDRPWRWHVRCPPTSRRSR